MPSKKKLRRKIKLLKGALKSHQNYLSILNKDFEELAGKSRLEWIIEKSRKEPSPETESPSEEGPSLISCADGAPVVQAKEEGTGE